MREARGCYIPSEVRAFVDPDLGMADSMSLEEALSLQNLVTR